MKNNWKIVLVLVGLFLLSMVVIGGAVISRTTLMVPKTGASVNHQVVDPETNDLVDDLSLRYTGGTYSMVEVSSTDWDESISRVSRTSKLWVNDDWHVQATWLGESAEYVRVRIELREGPAMMFRLLRNEE